MLQAPCFAPLLWSITPDKLKHHHLAGRADLCIRVANAHEAHGVAEARALLLLEEQLEQATLAAAEIEDALQ